MGTQLLVVTQAQARNGMGLPYIGYEKSITTV